jgi:hypothetical protein
MGGATRVTLVVVAVLGLAAIVPLVRDDTDDVRRGAPDALSLEGRATPASPDLQGRPDGPAWRRLRAAADGLDPGRANLADQDSDHDIATLAAALAFVGTGDERYRRLVVEAATAAIGTERNRDSHCRYRPNRARSLAVARNLPAYLVAAKLVGFVPGASPAADRFAAWVDRVRRTANCPNTGSGRHPDGNWFDLAEAHDASASNGSALAGAARIAAAEYLDDRDELLRAWTTYRRFAGDRTVGRELDFTANGRSWTSPRDEPRALNPPGARLDGHLVDGALVNDLGRGGAFRWPPGFTGYPWEGLQGLYLQAFLLDRAGLPAWTVEERAPLRALAFLHRLWRETGEDGWWDKADWVKHLAARVYGVDLPVRGPADTGQNFAWTDWLS